MISICVPTYARPEMTRIALESCVRQNHGDFEILISDDTQGPEIRQLAESFQHPAIRYVHNDPPLGLNRKLNVFLEQARGEWLTILCNDDFFEPDYLSTVSKIITAHPDAAMIRTRYRLVDAGGRLIRLDRSLPFSMNPCEFLEMTFRPEKNRYKMNISGVLFPRKLLRELGGFQLFHKGWHVDCLAWAQLGSKGKTFCTPEALCDIRIHEDSLSSALDPKYEEWIESTLRMEHAIDELLDGMDRSFKTAEAKKLLQKTRYYSEGYTQRHLKAALDHAFLRALSLNGTVNLAPIFHRFKELELPLFRSSYVYSLLGALPESLRLPAVSALCRYKFGKLAR